MTDHTITALLKKPVILIASLESLILSIGHRALFISSFEDLSQAASVSTSQVQCANCTTKFSDCFDFWTHLKSIHG
jgi:hypothetical protein